MDSVTGTFGLRTITRDFAVRLRYYDSAVATRITLYDLLAEALFLYSALPSKIGQSTGY
ncbi:hypothetical protein [uncultured Gemmiger sp.]|uniref:hypothetical protein n=1 Tax=uncultured Gemmiger sp. TaxID=1623490 RepID=UPI0025F5DA7E|nr:hypothetical protein [uncultured Gemmiger sp.]